MPRSRVYVDLGRGEVRAGRGLDVLLAAYRVGARVAWRRLSAAGEDAGLEPHDAVPARGVDLRLHRRAVGQVGRGLRAGAVGGGRRAPRAAPAARAAARARPAGRPARRRGGRARGRVAAAAHARGVRLRGSRERADRAAPARRRDRRDGRRRGVRARARPGPPRPPQTAPARRRGAPCRGAGAAGRVERRGALASRARARCWSWRPRAPRPTTACSTRAEHATALLLRSDRRLAQELVRARLAPLHALGAGPRSAADGDAVRLARGAGAAAGGRRAAARPPADRALPHRAAARAVRRRSSTTRSAASSWSWRCAPTGRSARRPVSASRRGGRRRCVRCWACRGRCGRWR